MYDLKCYHCGQFCIPVDYGIFYGSCCDFEPPDPVYFCKKCFEKQVVKAKENPDKVISRCWWVKPYYVIIAKSIRRHRAKEIIWI